MFKLHTLLQPPSLFLTICPRVNFDNSKKRKKLAPVFPDSKPHSQSRILPQQQTQHPPTAQRVSVLPRPETHLQSRLDSSMKKPYPCDDPRPVGQATNSKASRQKCRRWLSPQRLQENRRSRGSNPILIGVGNF